MKTDKAEVRISVWEDVFAEHQLVVPLDACGAYAAAPSPSLRDAGHLQTRGRDKRCCTLADALRCPSAETLDVGNSFFSYLAEWPAVLYCSLCSGMFVRCGTQFNEHEECSYFLFNY